MHFVGYLAITITLVNQRATEGEKFYSFNQNVKAWNCLQTHTAGPRIPSLKMSPVSPNLNPIRPETFKEKECLFSISSKAPMLTLTGLAWVTYSSLNYWGRE